VNRAEAAREEGDLEIFNVSAWVLRGGVVASVAVMALGLVLAFVRNPPTVARMETVRFDSDFLAIFSRAARLDGQALIELGIFMLVLTPILRVASSMVIFIVHERDWLYAAITFAVLALTLASLLVLN
jgi:uncharacterized membrane protein